MCIIIRACPNPTLINFSNRRDPRISINPSCTGHISLWSQRDPAFPAQRPVTRSFDVFFDLRLNILLSKQSRGWGFETPSRPLWRHCNVWVSDFSPSWRYQRKPLNRLELRGSIYKLTSPMSTIAYCINNHVANISSAFFTCYQFIHNGQMDSGYNHLFRIYMMRNELYIFCPAYVNTHGYHWQ